MKKILLAFSLAMVSVFGAFAQGGNESITLGYCGDDITGFSWGERRVQVGAAIEIPAETAELYKGGKMTAVSLGVGTSRNAYVNIFISKDINAEPVYVQTSVRVNRNEWTEVILDTPFDITGEKFFIGYYQETASEYDYPLGADKDTENANPYSCYFGKGETVEDMRASFVNMSEDFGNACIRGIISGENLPMDVAKVRKIDVPRYVQVGSEFNTPVTFRNIGANEISKIKVGATVGNDEMRVFEFDVNPAVSNYKDFTVTLEGLKSDTENLRMPLKVEALEINGNTPSDKVESTVEFMCSGTLPQAAVVVEEATGTWCQWCVRGYVGMESMKERYDNDPSYIGIGVHADDELAAVSYRSWIKANISGFPSAYVNRTESFDPSESTLEAMYQKYTKVSEVALNIEGAYNRESMQYKAKIGTKFFGALNNIDYGIAVVLTEDNVGPCVQMNAYAGGGYGPCGGFEDKPQAVALMYNDVARVIYDWQGAQGSIPTDVEKDMVYDYEIPVSMRYATNPANCTLIALLIDRSTGKIITGCKKKLNEDVLAGVDETFAQGPAYVEMFVEDNAISLEGEFDSAEVFTLDGSRVGALTANGTIATGNGVFMVKIVADGKTEVRKVLVK